MVPKKVLEPVSTKIGTEQVSEPVSKKFGTEKSLGIGLKKFDTEKILEPVAEFFRILVHRW